MIKCCRMVRLIFGVAIMTNRKFMDGRKDEPMNSANLADLTSQGKYLFYEYPV